jgi:cold shock CspA family protein
MEGTIVRMFSDKKFGFLQDEHGKDYFFHSSDVNGFFDDLVEDLQKGQKIHVTFDVVASPKGARAANVTRVV